ncbi:MAG: MoxR family ATPase [Planctomycetes bacterium]|nr:MoxR family ATPase [Planctomycetota bacterium]
MKFPFYKGERHRPDGSGAVHLPKSHLAAQARPDGYLADPGLTDAVNVALLLGQPLLLTGEPGTGKTQLAYSLAWELGFPPPLKFETKSTSSARDLFYYYNTIGRFHAAQTGRGSDDALDYLTYNALGLAILLGQEKSAVESVLPKDFSHDGPRRSVVLIDEIDKAPRDLPNDILNEVEEMYFRIPELQNIKIAADAEMRPILVITSNSEKHLPDAFLRRCVYYHIPFPDRPRLAQIVESRLGDLAGQHDGLLGDALDLFFRLREDGSGLRKKPATAELLGWLTAIRDIVPDAENPLRSNTIVARQTVSSVVKTAEDQSTALQIVEEWIASRR